MPVCMSVLCTVRCIPDSEKKGLYVHCTGKNQGNSSMCRTSLDSLGRNSQNASVTYERALEGLGRLGQPLCKE